MSDWLQGIDVVARPDLSAVATFVNRGEERSRFHLALDRHRAACAGGENDPSAPTPRNNVMVFYGVGGYGKSELSKQLERELRTHQADRPERERDVLVQLKLDAGWDFEIMLLAIRAALRAHGPLPAFDVVLSEYWAKNGVEPRAAVRENKVLSQVSGALSLPDQFVESLQLVAGALGSTGVPITSTASLLSKIWSHRRDKKRKRTLIDECPDFLELFEKAGDDPHIRGHFPKLLAWELWQRKVSLVVFLDEFEVLAENEVLEKYMNLLVGLMPNAFFLITGRDRLEWGDQNCPREVPVRGPITWPGLAPGASEEPRQHLIDKLSDADAEKFLCDRIRLKTPDGSDGGPAIPGDIRAAIVKAADGWPLYLDVAVDVFKEVGGLTPKDFEAAGIDRLVTRLARNLSEPERNVLRAMGLLERFDLAIAADVAGTSEGVAVRMQRRALVQHDPSAFWPYYLSKPIVDCVRKASAGDAWTKGDWKKAAERALSELGKRHEQAESQHDRVEVINYLNQGIRLAHEFDLDLAWIGAAAHNYVSDYVWEPTLAPRVPSASRPEEIKTAAHAVGRALIAIRERQERHRSETLAELDVCLQSNHLTGDARDLVAYFRAECLRDLGRAQEAESAMTNLVGDGRMMSLQAEEGLIYGYRRNGFFVRAQQAIDELPQIPLRWRLQGDIFWNHAQFAEADQSYERSCEMARAENLTGQHAEAEASRAFALAFEGGPSGEAAIANARELLKSARIKWGDLQTDNAELLLLAGTAPNLNLRCTEAMRAGEEAGLSSITAYAVLVAAFDAVLRADDAALNSARAQLEALVYDRHLHYLLEIVDFWTGAKDSSAYEADWIDADATRARWRDVLEARRLRMRS